MEATKLMQNREGVQKGPQDHAEGQHGTKTHSKFLEQLHSGNGTAPEDSLNGVKPRKHIARQNAAHRLFEERQQHDDAEKKSEKTRLNREVERRHLDPNDIPTI
jgi:hypothetical protein